MKNYLIVKLHRAEEILSDYHDLSLSEYESNYEKLCAFAQSLNAVVFASDGTNDIIKGKSYAEIEHNFDLTQSQKEQLIQLIKPFFNDGKIVVNQRGKIQELETINTLTAVKFIKTDGEIYVI